METCVLSVCGIFYSSQGHLYGYYEMISCVVTENLMKTMSCIKFMALTVDKWSIVPYLVQGLFVICMNYIIYNFLAH